MSISSPDSTTVEAADEPEISAEECLRREKAIKGTEERFLFGENSDEEGWRSEALAVIDDIRQFVTEMSISERLPCDDNGIYLNLETKESLRVTVELSSAGFRVCGIGFDTLATSSVAQTEPETAGNDSAHGQNATGEVVPLNVYYETPYSLLDAISPSYRNSFSVELAQRLMELCK